MSWRIMAFYNGIIMRGEFAAFQSHLDLAKLFWSEILKPGDCAIDATCGNGQDTLELCRLALTFDSGSVCAIDIQGIAIERTKEKLEGQLPPLIFKRISFLQGCHAKLLQKMEIKAKLIVFNLGYLPGGNKAFTTNAITTLHSLKAAQSLLLPGGAISITCYPGHPEGAIEERLLFEEVARLAPQQWSCSCHRWLNRRQAPSLLFLQKKQ